jgi:hypothetical protein
MISGNYQYRNSQVPDKLSSPPELSRECPLGNITADYD